MSERLRAAAACLRGACDYGSPDPAAALGLLSMAREVCAVAEEAMAEYERALAEKDAEIAALKRWIGDLYGVEHE